MIATRVDALVRSLDVVLRRRAALGGLLGAVLIAGPNGLEIEDAEAKRKKKKKKKRGKVRIPRTAPRRVLAVAMGVASARWERTTPPAARGGGVRHLHRGGGLQRRHLRHPTLWRQRAVPHFRHQHHSMGNLGGLTWG